MDLQLDINIANQYKSKSQMSRVMTEDWVMNNAYCPNCGNDLTNFENNRPVADFFCSKCNEEFELKSKKGINIGKKIVAGAYSTMIDRISSENNPNFFFLTYRKDNLKIINFLIIPNYYFVEDIIEKRNPLSVNACRVGWVGCNIVLSKIPNSGRIFLVKSANIISKKTVIKQWNKTTFLKNKRGKSKGWILDVMKCLDNVSKNEFTLKDIYQFENTLKARHPNNKFIKDKIRQQLQILRDKGIIKFLGRGKYKKIIYDKL